MAAKSNVTRDDHVIVHSAERFVCRVFAFIAGLVLVVAGVGLGMSVVLMPVGVPVGLAGLFLCILAISGAK